MALNENYNNGNNGEKKFSPTLYSPYAFKNPGGVDPSALSFTFWQKSLKVAVSPKIATSSADKPEYDYKNNIYIFLNHTKAYVLYNEICEFQKNPDLYTEVGVPSGLSLISISNGKEFGTNGPCLIIRKTDEGGRVVSSYAYEFKTDYYYGIRNFNANDGSFDKVTNDYNDLELEMFKSLLFNYYQAMSGAMAYSVVDAMNYDTNKTNTKLDQICQKLGVSFNGGGGNGGSGNRNYQNSFFNKTAPTNYSSKSLDDVDEDIE